MYFGILCLFYYYSFKSSFTVIKWNEITSFKFVTTNTEDYYSNEYNFIFQFLSHTISISIFVLLFNTKYFIVCISENNSPWKMPTIGTFMKYFGCICKYLRYNWEVEIIFCWTKVNDVFYFQCVLNGYILFSTGYILFSLLNV